MAGEASNTQSISGPVVISDYAGSIGERGHYPGNDVGPRAVASTSGRTAGSAVASALGAHVSALYRCNETVPSRHQSASMPDVDRGQKPVPSRIPIACEHPPGGITPWTLRFPTSRYQSAQTGLSGLVNRHRSSRTAIDLFRDRLGQASSPARFV